MCISGTLILLVASLGVTLASNQANPDNPHAYNRQTADSAVDGGWSGWSDFGNCSVGCGHGRKNRTRNCTNPEPTNGGADCVGEATNLAYCFVNRCPVDGGWARWSYWSSCSGNCGTGYRVRGRTCTYPEPANGGEDCKGENLDNEECKLYKQCDHRNNLNNQQRQDRYRQNNRDGQNIRDVQRYGQANSQTSKNKDGQNNGERRRNGYGQSTAEARRDGYGHTGSRTQSNGYGQTGRQTQGNGYGQSNGEARRDGYGITGSQTQSNEYGQTGRQTQGNGYGQNNEETRRNGYGQNNGHNQRNGGRDQRNGGRNQRNGGRDQRNNYHNQNGYY